MVTAFSGKASLSLKKSYLLAFSDNKTEILEVCLSKSYRTLFRSILLLIYLIFSLILIFIISYSEIVMNCLMIKSYNSQKNEYGSLV